MTATTATDFTHCRCGHMRSRHPEELEEACAIRECDCTEYVPSILPRQTYPQPAPAPIVTGDDPDELLTAGRSSPFKRTAALAAKIDAMLVDLAARLDEEAAQSETHKEIAELEAKLRAAKAKLRGDQPPAAKNPTGGEHPCPECGRTLSTLQALGSHRFSAHRVRKAEATA